MHINRHFDTLWHLVCLGSSVLEVYVSRQLRTPKSYRAPITPKRFEAHCWRAAPTPTRVRPAPINQFFGGTEPTAEEHSLALVGAPQMRRSDFATPAACGLLSRLGVSLTITDPLVRASFRAGGTEPWSSVFRANCFGSIAPIREFARVSEEVPPSGSEQLNRASGTAGDISGHGLAIFHNYERGAALLSMFRVGRTLPWRPPSTGNWT